jgi:hypothetical protein
MAGALALGDFADRLAVGQYFHLFTFGGTDRAHTLWKLLTDAIPTDDPRWYEIALAAYLTEGIPRPSIGSLARGTSALSEYDWQPGLFLSAAILSKLPSGDRDERLIRLAVSHLSDPMAATWGVATMFHDNYAHHPLALDLMRRALEGGNFRAIEVAQWMTSSHTDALVAPALHATVLFLRSPYPGDDVALSGDWWEIANPACRLLLLYGDDAQFEALPDALRAAQKEKGLRHQLLWQAAAAEGTSKRRQLDLIRAEIDDDTTIYGTGTYARDAAWRLQKLVGVDFDLKPNQTPQQSAEALRRAREWLAQHPEG